MNPIVGISASTKEKNALTAFFRVMPADTGASFIIVQHLPPDDQNPLVELLKQETVMDVRWGEDGAALEGNTVYVIPTGKTVRVEDHCLRLEEQEPHPRRQPTPSEIDIFFKSLAENSKTDAIGVILSGKGSEGTQGILSIRDQGGLVLAQDPATAESDDRPLKAIPTDLVDVVLPPQDLANTVYTFIRSPFAGESPSVRGEARETTFPQSTLLRFIELLGNESEVDFSHYKPNTLSRRIQRRCLLAGFHDLEDYLEHLQQSQQEQRLLRSDLLINLTQFFRDPDVWADLEREIIPQLFAAAAQKAELRVWVTACATGEEAYSLAILLDEARKRLKIDIHIKIFATDVDAESLEKASEGQYSLRIADHLSEERLQQYFIPQDGGYRVTRYLREMLIFSKHDLMRDAMLPRMNLISCRNILIYWQPAMQQQVLKNLHFALVSRGYLFLGEAETLGPLSPEFTPLPQNRTQQGKIFQKIRDIRLTNTLKAINTGISSRPNFISFHPVKPKSVKFNPLLDNAFREWMKDKNTTCFLIDQNNQLLHIVADPLKLLAFPTGDASLDIAPLLPKPLRLPLSTAIRRAYQADKQVQFAGIQLHEDDGGQTVSLGVRYHNPGMTSGEDFFLVTILNQQSLDRPQPQIPEFQADEAVARHVSQLEYDLQQTRENLQSTIEELESINEEQQSSNEELIASNEELQSTNEELHSVNEELNTINSEYQAKIRELIELNADINSLLQNTNIAVVFLTKTLHIRKFTAAIGNIIALRETDVGRSLEELAVNINLPNLVELVQAVGQQERCIQREVRLTTDGSYYLLRINPYYSSTKHCEGTVLSFLDINEIKQAEAVIKRLNESLEQRVQERTASLAELNRHYQLIFQGSRAGLFFWEVSADKLTYSQKFCQILGWDPDRPLVDSFRDFATLLHPEDQPRIQEAVNLHLSRQIAEPYQLEYRLQRSDGRYIWIVATGQATWDENNQPSFMAGLIQDVTDRKEAELRLRALNERYELVFAGSQAGLALWDIAKGQVEMSPRLCEILGYGGDMMQIKAYADLKALIHPDDLPLVDAALTTHWQEKTPYSVEFRMRHQAGDDIWLRQQGQAVWDAGDRPIFMAKTVEDISERKRDELNLQQTVAELQRVSRAKDEFLATMSHELRTPLNAVMGISESLEEGIYGALTDLQLQKISTIYTAGEHLLSLINDVLDTVTDNLGKLKLECQPANLDLLCRTCVGLVRQQAQRKQQQLTMRLPAQLPLIYVDEHRIRQCILNLLSNAVKFTPEGGSIHLTVEVRPAQEGTAFAPSFDQLRLCVTDTGIGVSPELHNRIFEPFYQVDSSLSRHQEGTGLGLHLTQQIIHLHDGTMGLESVPGQGSSFWFELPCRDDLLSTGSGAEAVSDMAPSAEGEQDEEWDNANVLILFAEDNDSNQETIQEYLELADFQVVTAVNGQMAIEMAIAHRPDIILMDIQMPVMNGLEAIRQLRQMEDFKTTPIIALTALAMNGDRQKCLDAGANDYLAKPFKLSTVVKMIKKLLT